MPFDRGVIKPAAGIATESTSVVTGIGDLRRVSRDCRTGNVSTRAFILEEFVDGVEWFADGVMTGGELRFLSIGKYAQNCLAAINEHQPIRTTNLDPTAEKWIYDLARPLILDSLSALELGDGIFHLEMFYDNQTGTDDRTGALVFGECAARRGGGPICDEISYKFGVDLVECAVRIALGDPVEISPLVRDGVVASTYLPVVTGTTIAYPSAAEVLARDGVVHTRLYLPLGYRHAAGAATSTYGRLGDVTVHADTEQTALRQLDAISAWFTERMDVLPLSSTFRELWNDPRNAGFVEEAGDLSAI